MNQNDQTLDALNFQIPLTPQYDDETIEICKKETNVTIPLQNGEHVVTSDLMDVGHHKVNCSAIQAQISLWYDYDARNRAIKICASDFVSRDSTQYTMISKMGSCQYVRHIFSHETHEEDRDARESLLPNQLRLLLHKNLHVINHLIDESLKSCGFTVLVRTPPPQLSQEEWEKLSLVYHDGVFSGFYNPEKAYSENDIIQSCQSTWGGIITLDRNAFFANVIGSTGDYIPCHAASWIRLWEDNCNNGNRAQFCTSDGFPLIVECNSILLGGHVVLGKSAKPVQPRTNQVVFIMPICNKHNNNNGIYMSPIKYNQGIWLDNYKMRESTRICE